MVGVAHYRHSGSELAARRNKAAANGSIRILVVYAIGVSAAAVACARRTLHLSRVTRQQLRLPEVVDLLTLKGVASRSVVAPPL